MIKKIKRYFIYKFFGELNGLFYDTILLDHNDPTTHNKLSSLYLQIHNIYGIRYQYGGNDVHDFNMANLYFDLSKKYKNYDNYK